jgi:hypothetical protein
LDLWRIREDDIMLILFLVVFVVLAVLGFCVLDVYDHGFLSATCGVLGVLGCIISTFAIVVATITAISVGTIPAKLDVLAEQNQKIEQQINAIAENYLEHEGATYDKLTPDNAEMFAVAYPQLASNETIKKQMDLYIENNAKITELKLEQCNGPVYRWWLYFGR